MKTITKEGLHICGFCERDIGECAGNCGDRSRRKVAKLENVEIHIFRDGSETAHIVIYPDNDGKFTIDENLNFNAQFQIINKGENYEN